MKVHLRQIQDERSHLGGEEEFPIADLAGEDVRSAGMLSYSLDLGISEGALFVTGSIRQKLDLRCVRCLEWFPFEIAVKSFSLHLELTGPEEIDLTPYLREDILLNLPPHPHCDREGGRICPAATRDTNEASAGEKRAPDWSELDKLKLKR